MSQSRKYCTCFLTVDCGIECHDGPSHKEDAEPDEADDVCAAAVFGRTLVVHGRLVVSLFLSAAFGPVARMRLLLVVGHPGCRGLRRRSRLVVGIAHGEGRRLKMAVERGRSEGT